jgi:hypothetical protein
MKQIFLSYVREDGEAAERLYNDLKKAGLKVWMDRKDLIPGQRWRPAIKKAIKESSHFLALLSSSSVSKQGFFQKELKTAREVLEEMPEFEIFMIPARLDNCEPAEDWLQEFHRADLFPQYESGLEQILRAFKSADAVVIDPVPAPVSEKPPVLKDSSAKKEPVGGMIGGHKPPHPRRSTPLEVSEAEFIKVFKLNDDLKPLAYVPNQYQDNGDGTITDRATGLTWEKSGSKKWLTYKEAQNYVTELNRQSFADYKDWRLPTIDELTSLLEPEENSKGLYIDPMFDSNQSWCWSSDTVKGSGGWGWVVGFYYGSVRRLHFGPGRDVVRCVRD